MQLLAPHLQAAGIVLLIGACAKRPKPPELPPPAFTSTAWTAHRDQSLSYTDHFGLGTDRQAPDHTTEAVREHCAPVDLPEGAPELGLEAPTACRVEHPDGTSVTTLYGRHEVGEVYFGGRTNDGEWRFHSPKVSVPATFDPGDRWSARHTEPTGDQLRRCDVEATPWCAGGAAITCVTLRIHHVTWVRNHWCPDHGHVGHEGLVVRPDQPPFWSWSSDPRRGEQALPDLPVEQRPIPDLEVLMGLAHALTPGVVDRLSPDEARIPEGAEATPPPPADHPSDR